MSASPRSASHPTHRCGSADTQIPPDPSPGGSAFPEEQRVPKGFRLGSPAAGMDKDQLFGSGCHHSTVCSTSLFSCPRYAALPPALDSDGNST